MRSVAALEKTSWRMTLTRNFARLELKCFVVPPFSAAAYLKATGATDGLCKFACQGAFAATSGTRDTNGKRYCMWVHTAAFPPCLQFRCPHLLCWHGRRAERGSLFNLCRLCSTADPRRGVLCGTGLELKVAIARLAHVEKRAVDVPSYKQIVGRTRAPKLWNANVHPYTSR